MDLRDFLTEGDLDLELGAVPLGVGLTFRCFLMEGDLDLDLDLGAGAHGGGGGLRRDVRKPAVRSIPCPGPEMTPEVV